MSLLLFLSTFVAQAATLDVCADCTYTDLQAAVAASSDGDIIEVGDGDYGPIYVVGTTGLEIRAAAGASPVLVRPESSARVVSVLSGADVTFVGIDVIGGDGGGIIVRGGSTVRVVDAELYGATGILNGGAVLLREGSTVELQNVVLRDNTVSGGANGGHIAAVGGSHVQLTDVDVLRGQGLTGGGVYLVSSSLHADGGSWAENLAIGSNAEALGGAIYAANGATVELEGVSISGSESDGGGGAIYVDGGTLSMSSVRLEGNTAATNGGAVSLTNAASLTWEGVEFFENSAVLGGAVYATSVAGLTLIDAIVEANQGSDGAGLYMTSGTALTLNNARLCHNAASGSGGGIYASSITSFIMGGSELCANSAGVEGGGFFLSNVSSAQMNNLGVVENQAITGGGGLLRNVGASTIRHSTFGANVASTGAALAFEGGSAAVNSAIFADSTGGAAIALTNSGVVGVTYSNLWNNAAGDFGGLLAASGNDATNLFDDPMLRDLSADGECFDDLTVDVASPTIDAGDPSYLDPADTTPSAQSPSDMGLFGGPDADPFAWADVDGDGYPFMWDCDDTNASVFPTAVDICNAQDDDCDGLVDEDGGVGGFVYYLDADGDSFGDDTQEFYSCGELPTDAVLVGGDCDDDNAEVNPDADEVCDGVDNNCDGALDNDATDAQPFFFDGDGDGVGVGDAVFACEALDGFAGLSGDCDDDDVNAFPDADEVCDGVDNNCDGALDNDAVDAVEYLLDLDGDGFGADTTLISCEAPDNAAEFDGDCDDANADISPEAVETCNGIDDDCDGEIDGPRAVGATELFVDADGDGFGDTDLEVTTCPGDGFSAVGGDCDDAADYSYPGAEEVCDGEDNDCDGSIDEDAVEDATWYPDADGDGFGVEEGAVQACEQPADTSREAGDCDDTNADAYPGAEDVPGDGVDQDCDGEDAEGEPTSSRDWEPAEPIDSGVGDGSGGCSCDASTGVFGGWWLGGVALLGLLGRRRVR